MKRKNKIGSTGESLIFLGLGLGVAAMFFLKFPDKANVPPIRKPKDGSSIKNIEEFETMSDTIKSILSDGLDWHAISEQFWRLQNQADMDTLIVVFGNWTWDGYLLAGATGNIFAILNAAYKSALYQSQLKYAKDDLSAIKKHSFGHTTQWAW